MKMKKIYLSVIIFVAILFVSCSGNADNMQETEEITTVNAIALQLENTRDFDVVYNPEKDLKMDILYPINTKYDKSPLVIAFHGGGWISGEKSQIIEIFTPLIQELRENGYTVATVQYGYVTDTLHFPAPLEDCRDAILYLEENCEKYNIDKDSVGLMGYSAGAQLAMLAAYAPEGHFNSEYKNNIKYCVSFAGPGKMYGDELNKFSDGILYLIEGLFGGTYKNKENDFISGSPYSYIEKNKDSEELKKIPLFLAHDEKDEVVPFNQSEVMYNLSVEAGIPCEFLKLNGLGHLINFNSELMTSPDSEEAVKTITDFIYKYSRK